MIVIYVYSFRKYTMKSERKPEICRTHAKFGGLHSLLV